MGEIQRLTDRLNKSSLGRNEDAPISSARLRARMKMRTRTRAGNTTTATATATGAAAAETATGTRIKDRAVFRRFDNARLRLNERRNIDRRRQMERTQRRNHVMAAMDESIASFGNASESSFDVHGMDSISFDYYNGGCGFPTKRSQDVDDDGDDNDDSESEIVQQDPGESTTITLPTKPLAGGSQGRQGLANKNGTEISASTIIEGTKIIKDNTDDDEKKKKFRKRIIKSPSVSPKKNTIRSSRLSPSTKKKERLKGRTTMSGVEGTFSAVRFDKVSVYEHPLTLGDNPSVSAGVPTTLTWQCTNTMEMELDYYEAYYSPHATKGKPKPTFPSRSLSSPPVLAASSATAAASDNDRGTALANKQQQQQQRRRAKKFSAQERCHILLRAGFDLDDIAHASLTVQRIQKGRMETLRLQSWDRFLIFVESARESISQSFRSPVVPTLTPSPTVIHARMA